MINAKKKGNRGENVFAEWLRDHGFKAYRDGASGASVNKGDIYNTMTIGTEGICFEVKTCKKINLLKCFQQANRDASMSHTSPVLATHFDNMPEKSWLITLNSEDFIFLIKNQK